MEIAPSAAPEGPIAAAILVDHSGSMAEACTPSIGGPTKHAAAVAGLAEIGALLGPADLVHLWEFANAPHYIGSATSAPLLATLAGRLSAPGGGTDIWQAVAAASGRGDVLLVTDGKAHAQDIQALARTVGRLTVVLVGEDSLEANVGHLAALTGGEIFIASGIDLAPVMAAAVRSLRRPRSPAPTGGDTLTVARGGFTITMRRASSPAEARPGVAALAAGLRLPHLERGEATALAVAEGIVCHLTSLVLVDEDGPVQHGLPGYRKVSLPAPAPVACAASMVRASLAAPPARASHAGVAIGLAEVARSGPPSTVPEPQVDWDAAPQRLAEGDLSGLPHAVRNAIETAAALLPIRVLAKHMRLAPTRLALGLLARRDAARSRSAARIAKAILGDRAAADLDAAAAAIWG